MKILIAYDGTINSKSALKYGIGKLKEEGGRATVLHLFHSAMFVDYGAGPNAESMARAEAARHLAEARKIIDELGAGLWIKVEEADGEPEAEVLGYLDAGNFDVVLAPPRFKSLSRKAHCPVILVPGTILVPVDNSTNSVSAIEQIIREATSTGSKVVLLGIVPVHMYGISEKAELKKVETDTRKSMKEIMQHLGAKGVQTTEVMRPGYPDEEILKAMDEFAASIVIIPTLDDMPSELNKAASIILEDNKKKPILMVPAS